MCNSKIIFMTFDTFYSIITLIFPFYILNRISNHLDNDFYKPLIWSHSTVEQYTSHKINFK